MKWFQPHSSRGMLCKIRKRESDADTNLPTASPDNRIYTGDPDTHRQPLSWRMLPVASEVGVSRWNVQSVPAA